MKTAEYLWQLAGSRHPKTLPVLSFPVVQKMKVTVRQLAESGELQAKAMQIVAEETPAAASVSPMDLSVEAQAFGAQVRFSDDEVPSITGRLIETQEDADALRIPAVGDARTGVYIEGVRLAKQRIQNKPVLAGCIGPFSLAGRLCDVTEIMYACFDDPDMVHTVLKKATEFLIRYSAAFRDAGADGVILAEPLAGLLSSEMAAEFSCAYVRQIIDAVQSETFAVIYHNCGNTVEKMLPEIFSMQAAGYHFGNASDMRAILDAAPKTALCMGNIDPSGQLVSGTPQSVAEATRALLHACGTENNFILSSGCDIPPQAGWDNINAFFEAAESYRA